MSAPHRYHDIRVVSIVSRSDQLSGFSVTGLVTRTLLSSVRLKVHRSSEFLRGRFISKLERRWISKANTTSTIAETPAEMPPAKSMVWMPVIQKGVFRFDATEGTRKEASPSLSFANPRLRESPVQFENADITKPRYIPKYRNESGLQTTTLELDSDTNFYGTGEVSGPLERSGKKIFTWNTDAWGYGPSTTSLYQSHPWVLAVLPNGDSIGFLADCTRRCEVDLRSKSTIRIVAKEFYPIVTFGPFASPEAVLSALCRATGAMAMPPKWAIGYHQCRWSYMTSTRVCEIAKTFRDKRLPCDVLWMDIDYMDGFRCFTFHPENFPNPGALSKYLHNKGFKGVWMLDPGIKNETGYKIFDSGSDQDTWVLQANGKPYLGEVWPGLCVFPDYTQEKVRKWWAELVKNFVSHGVDGIWNDMNEPAIFKSLSKTMPQDNLHRGDEELGGRQSHLHYHNVYGMLMARSTYEGMLLANSDRRPFVLTRAAYIGSQRYAATWTGDNLSSWEHLQMTIAMALNLSLSGQPFSGPDIGGFGGNCTPKLFARWMGFAALLPFSRGHSEAGTNDHEPWAFGKECENVCRLALNRRYMLLPHLYTLFYRAHTTGSPVIAPIFFADLTDLRLRHVETSFLLGAVLVSTSSVPNKGVDRLTTILPFGIWHLFDFDDYHPDLPLIFLKGGAIIVTGPVVQNVDEANRSDPVTLVIALDEQGKAEGEFYEDDGVSFEYLKEQFLLTFYEAQMQPNEADPGSGGRVSVKVKQSIGSWSRPHRPLKVRLVIGDNTEVKVEGIDGEEVFLQLPAASNIAQLVESNKLKMTVADKGKSYDEIGFENDGIKQDVLELNGGEWALKVVPWIGGRIISMVHAPTGTEWLEGRLDQGAYEEYSGVEFRSPGCVENYCMVKQESANTLGAVCMECDIGGGLAMHRNITISKESPNVLHISSKIIAQADYRGTGGLSRVTCLRVHPSFKVANPMAVSVTFTDLDGIAQEIHAKPGDVFLRGKGRPNGEWSLVDKEQGMALVSRFKVEEVLTCVIHWSPGICNLELWSEEKQLSKEQSIEISHEYTIATLAGP